MTTLRDGPLQGRRAVLLVLGLFVAAGLVVIFAGTLTRSADVEAEAARVQAEIAALEARVLAGETEIEFFRGEAFREWQARVYGFGGNDETAFSLGDDAPSAPPIVPLGSSEVGQAAAAPLEAWMELLFGT